VPRRYKFKYDMIYVHNQSLALDVRLILLSFWINLPRQVGRPGPEGLIPGNRVGWRKPAIGGTLGPPNDLYQSVAERPPEFR